ncbi:myosin heavy chain, embryonic smooth muscle isoform-like [Uloborus diversus]|uniref:myosin heavy chain, embryonic smooth muscle isoform-like n=1 Tax=Uloborus diversus TaxID=327109 RepID=UPI002409D960|nr:myosin heavy chain, embryonic smooth muscle isoform-like [Uloborus diversus]
MSEENNEGLFISKHEFQALYDHYTKFKDSLKNLESIKISKCSEHTPERVSGSKKESGSSESENEVKRREELVMDDSTDSEQKPVEAHRLVIPKKGKWKKAIRNKKLAFKKKSGKETPENLKETEPETLVQKISKAEKSDEKLKPKDSERFKTENYVENKVLELHKVLISSSSEVEAESTSDDETTLAKWSESVRDLHEVKNEFSSLLEYFRQSFFDSERKNKKIFELKAKLSKNVGPRQEGNKEIEILNDEIEKLKTYVRISIDQNFDVANENENLRKQIEDLNSKLEVKEELAKERQRVNISDKESSLQKKKIPVGKETQGEEVAKGDDSLLSAEKEKAGPQSYNTCNCDDAKAQINELKKESKKKEMMLSMKLEAARAKVDTLTAGTLERDELIKQYSSRLSTTEKEIENLEHKLKELQGRSKSLESQSEKEQMRFKKLKMSCESLERENSQLRKEKEIFEELLSEFRDTADEHQKQKNEALKQIQIFEEYLAKSQRHLSMKNCEIEKLQTDLSELGDLMTRKFPPVKTFEAETQTRDIRSEMAIQEKIIDNYRGELKVQDRKVLLLQNEVEDLKQQVVSTRKSLRSRTKENSSLLVKLKKLEKVIAEKTAGLEKVQDKLELQSRSAKHWEKEAESATEKYRVAFEESRRFEELYHQMKNLSSHQKSEVALLVKRHEYLLHIIHNKDAQTKCSMNRNIVLT